MLHIKKRENEAGESELCKNYKPRIRQRPSRAETSKKFDARFLVFISLDVIYAINY